MAPGAKGKVGQPLRKAVQSARYEGLVTSFVEFLGAFGGRILSDDGRVVVDSPEGIRALTLMRDLLTSGAAPTDILTWYEEESRFAFQNGAAAMMRNWPYAVTLLKQPRDSRVAGKFAVAPMPGAVPAKPGSATLPMPGILADVVDLNGTPVPADARFELLGRLPQPESLLLLGRNGQNIHSLADLRGMSVGIGPEGSGTALAHWTHSAASGSPLKTGGVSSIWVW